MNKVMHFEIPVDDESRATKFYETVFEWQIMKVPGMDYHFATTTPVDPKTMAPLEPGGINGGLFKRDAVGNHPMIVIDVEDIDKHTSKIEQAGGKVVMQKVKVGDMGYYARVTDTEGNVIGIWQSI
jgi:predicted enzyme related to lactoylglutathione lyase